MSKMRLSSVDIRCVVNEMQSRLVGLRLGNLYDVSPKIYILKMAKPDHKEYVLLESGNRLHCTAYARSKPVLPSAFTMKLRKHLRTRRLESVQQLGIDRVVDMAFGTGEACYHLILEFYAKGNIILTDNNYSIITLLRTHKQDADAVYAVKEIYPIDKAAIFKPIEQSILSSIVNNGMGKSIKQVLNGGLEYGPALIEHCLSSVGLDPKHKISEHWPNSEQTYDLLSEIQKLDEWLQSNTIGKGYIYKPAEPTIENPYECVTPMALHQFSKNEVITFDSFLEALDEYFSKYEDTKAENEAGAKKVEKLSKVDKVKRDHENRIAMLKQAQDSAEKKASLILENVDDVEQAIQVVRSAIAQGIDWNELRRVIKEQQRAGNPIALLIHSLHLEESKISLLLSELTDDACEGDLTRPIEPVDVDISLSAHSNARTYYDNKRKSKDKEIKTVQATNKAVHSAQKKADTELKQQIPNVPPIKVMRKTYWFEKFHWFITSENFLVIAGRDAQQNEILVKKYLKPGDLYVHADIHGATSCIIKNPTKAGVPPSSLAQAGTMCVCRSTAWDNKIVTSAWWVYHNQVSKTAPSGEYLPVGSFTIRGKKNFLPPNQLLMGMALVFRVSDECVANHLAERRIIAEQFQLKTYHLETLPPESPMTNGTRSSNKSREWEGESGSRADITTNSDSEKEASISPDELVREFSKPERPNSEAVCNIDFSRYDLPQNPYDPTLDEPKLQDAVSRDSSGDSEGKKRMSAKERRIIKKLTQKPNETSPKLENKEENEGEEEGEDEGTPVLEAVSGQPPKLTNKIGKAKLKRMKKQMKEEQEKEKANPIEDKKCKPQVVNEPNRNIKKTPIVKNESEEVKIVEEEDISPKPNRPSITIQEEVEIRDILQEEGIEYIKDEDRKEMDLSELDALTGNPLPTDTILFAIPMCAPYSSISKYKCHVKITPGSLKRGKAVQTIEHYFNTMKDIRDEERQFIRAIENNDYITTALSNSAVSIPGKKVESNISKKGSKSK